MGLWDALSALAAGGQVFVDKKKKDLADKLEKDKLDNQHKYEQAQFDRELRAQHEERASTVAKSDMVVDPQGVHWKQDYNPYGKVINRTLASKEDIADAELETQSKQSKIDYETALAGKAKSEAGWAVEDHSLENRLKEAQIGNIQSEAATRDAGGVKGIVDNSYNGRLKAILDASKGLHDQYVGTPKSAGPLSESQYLMVIQRTMEMAKRNKFDSAATRNAISTALQKAAADPRAEHARGYTEEN